MTGEYKSLLVPYPSLNTVTLSSTQLETMNSCYPSVKEKENNTMSELWEPPSGKQLSNIKCYMMCHLAAHLFSVLLRFANFGEGLKTTQPYRNLWTLGSCLHYKPVIAIVQLLPVSRVERP